MSNWIAITKNGKPMIAGPIPDEKFFDWKASLPAYERTFEVEEGKILELGKHFTWRFERKYEDAWFSCNANDYMQTPEEHRRAVAIPVKEDMKFSVNTGEVDDGTMVAIPVPAKEESKETEYVKWSNHDDGFMKGWEAAKKDSREGERREFSREQVEGFAAFSSNYNKIDKDDEGFEWIHKRTGQYFTTSQLLDKYLNQ